MMLRSVTIALIVAAAGPAIAQDRGLPPALYDRPYKGRVSVEVVTDRVALRAACKGVSMTADACVLAPFGADGHCRIVVTKRHAGNELLMRHEYGHCNGWPSDHPGMRPYPQVEIGPPGGGHRGPVQPLEAGP
jgi:hypothetical protein